MTKIYLITNILFLVVDIFTRLGIVTSYHYIIPWQKYLLNFWLLFDCFHRHHMEQITDEFSLRKQNMFFVEMESEHCISTELWLIKSLGRQYQFYVTCIFKPDFLIATFVKGLCRGEKSQYLDLWRWVVDWIRSSRNGILGTMLRFWFCRWLSRNINNPKDNFKKSQQKPWIPLPNSPDLKLM